MSDEDVINDHGCPRCKARKGQPCTYLAGKVTWEYDDTGTYGRVYHSAHRAGDPTKVPHNERRQRYWKAVQRARLVEAREQTAGSASPALPAYKAFAAEEYAALRAWLIANHRISTTTTNRMQER